MSKLIVILGVLTLTALLVGVIGQLSSSLTSDITSVVEAR